MATYESGQVWKYQTRPGEEESRITVVAVDEHDKLGTIVHIFVSGLSIRNPHSSTGMVPEISHMPMSSQALDSCVTEMAEIVSELPDFREGYDTWKHAFDAGEGGVFSISVAKAIEFMEGAINQ